jgi:Domain of unknown function (DUF1864)
LGNGKNVIIYQLKVFRRDVVTILTKVGFTIDALYPLGDFSRFVVYDLPNYNMNNNFSALIESGKNLLPSMDLVLHIAYEEPFDVRVRAMGNLGIFLVSCKRTEISQTIVEPIICRLKLLASTTGLVPRDTYSSYITHNPTDALRTFTGDQSEVGFIRQHQKSDEAIKPAVDRMLLLQEEPYREDRFDLLRSVISSLKGLKEENAAVHKRVDPIFFMTCFRNYFFPIEIDGQLYNAPSGVHIANIIILDVVSGCTDAPYYETVKELLPYLEPGDQLKINHAMSSVSLKDRYLEDYKANIRDTTKELTLLAEIYQGLLNFRNVHQGLVTRYIRKQDPSVTIGTGGFPFDTFLQERIDMVKSSRDSVRKRYEGQ